MVSVLSVATTQGPSGSVSAQGPNTVVFRIETDVFEADEPKPVQRSLTLFQNGVAYNLSHDSGELMLVDWSGDRIVLINKPQQIQTTVEISKLQELLRAAKTQMATTTLVMYSKGAEKVDANENRIRIGDALMLYESTLQRPESSTQAKICAQEYRKFADATKLLSAFAGPPPFHRLRLNQAVSEKDAIPQEINLKMRVGDSTVHYKSILHANWLLSKDDQNRINEFGEMMATFESLDYEEFQKRNSQQVRMDQAKNDSKR